VHGLGERLDRCGLGGFGFVQPILEERRVQRLAVKRPPAGFDFGRRLLIADDRREPDPLQLGGNALLALLLRRLPFREGLANFGGQLL
jgi:hypothetical protein